MRRVGWGLAFLALLALAAVLFFGPNDALAQSRAVDDGTARAVPSTLHASFDANVRHRYGKPDRNGPDEWLARCDAADDNIDIDLDHVAPFNIPGRGEILHEWDEKAVTCYVWDERSVVAIKGPDGTVITSDDVGWHGVLVRYALGAGALGIALLIGGIALRFGTLVAVAGGMVVVVAVMVALPLFYPRVGVVIDVVVGIGLVWLLVVTVRGGKGASDA